MAKLPAGVTLSLLNEIIVVLEGRKPLEHRHDPIKATLHLAVVGLEASVGGPIGERVTLNRVGGMASPARD